MEYNPYQSPVEMPAATSKPSIHDGIPISANCILRTWSSRHILLTGGINAEIRYHSAGIGEKIYVNEIHAGTGSYWHILTVVAPRIDFQINCGSKSVPATVEVYASWLQFCRITRFSLRINGELVYTEP